MQNSRSCHKQKHRLSRCTPFPSNVSLLPHLSLAAIFLFSVLSYFAAEKESTRAPVSSRLRPGSAADGSRGGYSVVCSPIILGIDPSSSKIPFRWARRTAVTGVCAPYAALPRLSRVITPCWTSIRTYCARRVAAPGLCEYLRTVTMARAGVQPRQKAQVHLFACWAAAVTPDGLTLIAFRELKRRQDECREQQRHGLGSN